MHIAAIEDETGLLLVGALVGLIIGSIIGAVVLRAAVALYNKLARGSRSANSVPEPSFEHAFGIIIVSGLINAALSITIRQHTSAAQGLSRSGDLGAQLVSLLIGWLVIAVMLRILLPTSFGKGILVTLCYLLIMILVVAAIAAIVGLVMAFTGMRFH